MPIPEWLPRVFRFGIAGFAAFATNICVFYLVSQGGVWYLVASAAGFLSGFVTSFALQKFWTFGDRETKRWKQQASAYFAVIVFNLGVNTGMVFVLVEYAGFLPAIAQITATAAIASWSFFAYKLIFSKEAPQDTDHATHATIERCPVCGNGAGRPLLRSHRDGGTLYRLFACGACSIQYWQPFKNPGAEWYGHDERYAGRNQDPLLEPTDKHRETISLLAPRTGRVLDVGCGTGNFLYYARSKGWHVRGIDFDKDAIETGKNVFKIEGLEVADLGEFKRRHSEEQFDLITFFDVIEHIDDHREFMEEVRTLLKPGGYIAMTMPYRKHAAWLNPKDLPPRHLTMWDRMALRTFLLREGFEVVHMARKTEGLGFIVLKLRFRYGQWFSFGAVDTIKRAVRKGGGIEVGSRAEKTIRAAKILARIKDAVLFGIPAICIWLCMLPSPKRYVTLFCIARKKT